MGGKHAVVNNSLDYFLFRSSRKLRWRTFGRVIRRGGGLYGEGSCSFGNISFLPLSWITASEGDSISELEKGVFRLLCRSSAPSKVIAFSWNFSWIAPH